MSLDWVGGIWYWITLWWLVWYAIFLTWYSKQLDAGKKEKVSPAEAFFMFILSGFGPVLAITIIIGKAMALNNDKDDDT